MILLLVFISRYLFYKSIIFQIFSFSFNDHLLNTLYYLLEINYAIQIIHIQIKTFSLQLIFIIKIDIGQIDIFFHRKLTIFTVPCLIFVDLWNGGTFNRSGLSPPV